ncbi:MAG: uncharacterized protein KVP18_002909 [Porospora cf. gigantea A]|nr:MAG: hypothetical protein KVP18_002909 [Porospora cf. gigantea A]
MSLIRPTRAPLTTIEGFENRYLPSIAKQGFEDTNLASIGIQVTLADWNSFLRWRTNTKRPFKQQKATKRFWRTARKPKLREQTSLAPQTKTLCAPVEGLPKPDSGREYVSLLTLRRRVHDQLQMVLRALQLLQQCQEDKMCLDPKATSRITAGVVETINFHVGEIQQALSNLNRPGILATPAMSAHFVRNSDSEKLSLETAMANVEESMHRMLGRLQTHHDNMELIAGVERPYTSSCALQGSEQALLSVQAEVNTVFNAYEWPFVKDILPTTPFWAFGVSVQPLLGAAFAIASSGSSGEHLHLDAVPLRTLLRSLGVNVAFTGEGQVGWEVLEVNLSSLTNLMKELGLSALPQYALLLDLKETRLRFYETDTVELHCTSTKVLADMYRLHHEALVALSNPPVEGFEHFKRQIERYLVCYQMLADRIPPNVRAMQRLFKAIIRVRQRYGYARTTCHIDESGDTLARVYGENCRAFQSGQELSMFIMTPLEETLMDVEDQLEQFMNRLKAVDLNAGNTYSRVLGITRWVRKQCKPLEMWLRRFRGKSDIISARTRKHLLYSLLKVYRQATEVLCSENSPPIHMKPNFLARIRLPCFRKELDLNGLSVDLDFVKADCDELLDTPPSACTMLTAACSGSLAHIMTPRETMRHLFQSVREEDGMVVFELPENSSASKDTGNSSKNSLVSKDTIKS